MLFSYSTFAGLAGGWGGTIITGATCFCRTCTILGKRIGFETTTFDSVFGFTITWLATTDSYFSSWDLTWYNGPPGCWDPWYPGRITTTVLASPACWRTSRRVNEPRSKSLYQHALGLSSTLCWTASELQGTWSVHPWSIFPFWTAFPYLCLTMRLMKLFQLQRFWHSFWA